MNRFRTLVMYCSLLLVTLVLIFGISRMEKQLDGMVREHHLRFTGQIKNAPPLVAFTTVALGSFRGLIADLLWFRAGGLQEKGNYFEMVQLARWITDLQPTFSGATAYLAWNMAYNISVTCSDYADRWRWVNEGIKLIRDRALDYNPEDPVLYKELGWIFQHKLGNILDDANLYYKNQIALAMTAILGANPDIPGMAAAPVGEKAFMEKYADNKRLWKAAAEAGWSTYAELFAAFKNNENELPRAFTERLDDAKLAGALENYFRAELLRERYKLDARVMQEIDEKYGQLDWRVPESQAIYWATMGLKKTPGNRDLNCERMITQSLYEAFRSGRLLMLDPKKFESVVSVPNLNLVDAVDRTFQEAYEANDKQFTFLSARINFMKEAITILFNYGKFKKAEEYFKKLAELDLEARLARSLEDFVMKRWAENVRDASVKKANDVISGLIFRSLFYLVHGDNDAALANERIARYIYNTYMSGTAKGQEFRVGLLPYADIKKAVVENCMKTFPPAMVTILKAKIEEEQAAAAAEAAAEAGKK